MKDDKNNFDKEPNLPFDENGKNPFELPQDYFSSFEEKIKKRLEAENELAEFPLLSSIKKTNSFETPLNYFVTIESKIELASYTKLQSLDKLVLKDLDEDYLNHLNSSVKRKVELIDELVSYRTLYAIDKVNSFITEENYFENVTSRIKERVLVSKQRNNSVLDSILDFIFGGKIAVAFSVVVIMLVSVYLYKVSQNAVSINNCETIACLEKNEILNEQSVVGFDEEQLMDLVDVKTLDKQLKMQTDTIPNEEFILENVNTDQLLEEL